MDPLESMSVIGGSDIFPAGTYSTKGRDTVTITWDYDTATETDTSTIMVNGLVRVLTRGVEDIDTCLAEFILAHAAAYLAIGFTMLQADLGILRFTAVNSSIKATGSVTNSAPATFEGVMAIVHSGLPHPVKALRGLAALVVTSARVRVPGVRAMTSVLTLSGNQGSARIHLEEKVYVIAYDTSLTHTADLFVAAYAAGLALKGITVTAAAGVLTFSSTIRLFDPPIIINNVTNLFGTVVTTGDDGLMPLVANFLGAAALADDSEQYFEHPVEQIVIASGTGVLFFIK